jgi:2-hydroxy-6-oxo-octa-2,4-dienoate hydrolase
MPMKKILVGVIVLVLAGVVLPPILSPLLGWGPDESAIPEPGRLLDVAGGHRINVLEIGSGPAIVLVHGLPGSAYDWRPLPEKLARGTHRIVWHDRVGYGHSDRRQADEEFTLEANALELLGLLDGLGIDRAVLVGWSYGGGVVQRVALRAPHRVGRLVLVGSIGPSSRWDAPSLARRILRSEPVQRWGLAAGLPARASVRQISALAFGSAEAIPPAWTERTLALMALPGSVHTWRREGRRVDLDGFDQLHVEDLRVPTLVIHGSDDLLVPARVGEDLHRRIAGSELLMVPDGSHMLPVTHADLLADRILAFARGGAGLP